MNVAPPPGSLKPEPSAEPPPVAEESRTRSLLARIANILLGKAMTLVLATLAFAVGLATFIILARGTPFGLEPAVILTVATGVALLYDWPLKSTVFSVLPYLVAFGLLPAFVVTALPGHPAPPAWLVVAAALLGGGAHFANVLPDLDDDAATGVRGLPHRLGATGSTIAAAVLLLGATLTLVFGPAGPPSWAGWSATAAAVVVLPLGWYAARRAEGRRVAMFRAVIVVALIDVVLLIFSGRVV